jgi:hypothetical protein
MNFREASHPLRAPRHSANFFDGCADRRLCASRRTGELNFAKKTSVKPTVTERDSRVQVETILAQ